MRGTRIFVTGGGDSGPMARIQDLHMGPIHKHRLARALTHMYRQAQADG